MTLNAQSSRGAAPETPFKHLSFCICTPDFPYFVKNGGIGTAFYHLAMWLIESGARVTIFYANTVDTLTTQKRAEAIRAFAALGLDIQFIFEGSTHQERLSEFIPNDIFTVSSYLAFHKLKDQKFDAIIFPDWRGLAYYSVFAKKQGLAFSTVRIWVQAHSTALWHALNNQQPEFGELDVRLYHMERKSIELSDAILGPTQYLLDWKRKHGFILPDVVRNLPYILSFPPPHRAFVGERVKIEEIVFFGRLERRKGLHVFIQALRRLASLDGNEGDRSLPKITFLGKVQLIFDETSVEFIERGMSGLGFDYTINIALDSEEAQHYVKSRNCLAVMPSVADNSPLTIHECIEGRVPFLASDRGGIPEIVAAEDHASVLVELDPRKMALRLHQILREGQLIARPAHDQAEVRRAWIDFVIKDLERSKRIVLASPKDLISVCITHYERPTLLKKTLEGLAAQTYKNFEVIVVDDGSKSPEAKEFLDRIARGEGAGAQSSSPWPFAIRLLSQSNEFVGAARNKAIVEARGAFVVFMDDDNYSHEKQLEFFLRAITTSGFDALSCAAIAFPETRTPPELGSYSHVFLPLGCGRSANLFGNLYGDANGIFRKTSLEACGGFSEDQGLSWEDFELYSKLEHAGLRTGVIPFALLFLRQTSGSVSRLGSMLPNHYRALRPALEGLPWTTYGDALLVAISEGLRKSSVYGAEERPPEPMWRKQLVRHTELGLPAIRWMIRGKAELGETRTLLADLRRLSEVIPFPERSALRSRVCGFRPGRG